MMHLTESIFKVVPVTNHGSIEHVSELALIVMGVEVKLFCWDCRVGHKVTMERPGQARGDEVGQPI